MKVTKMYHLPPFSDLGCLVVLRIRNSLHTIKYPINIRRPSPQYGLTQNAFGRDHQNGVSIMGQSLDPPSCPAKNEKKELHLSFLIRHSCFVYIFAKLPMYCSFSKVLCPDSTVFTQLEHESVGISVVRFGWTHDLSCRIYVTRVTAVSGCARTCGSNLDDSRIYPKFDRRSAVTLVHTIFP